MKIPYGITDFKTIRKENYLYVDKTKYIELLEEMGKYIFFIRPRRFGKTLFLSTLEAYYDISMASEFEELFGDLYIGQNPTEQKNRYLVLKLNFSGLDTNTEGNLRESFHKCLLLSVINFIEKYQNYIPGHKEVIDDLNSALGCREIMDILYIAVRRCEYKIYLIIDEYDHFANDIIALGDSQYYRNIIQASGFVRDFYENVKRGTEGIIGYIFMTGIAPIVLDDLTSGFNISQNITMDSLVNEMLGFSQKEVDQIIESLRETGVRFDDRLEDNLKAYYNGYLFSEDSSVRVYNPDMVLYYLLNYLRHAKPPKKLIDDNMKTDYGRLELLISNPANRQELERIIENETIVADIVTKFSFERMYDQNYFVSLLFYLGFLTIDQQIRTRLVLKIPNFVIRELFWEYFRRRLEEEIQVKYDTDELKFTIEAMAYEGDIWPYIDYLQRNVIRELSNRDLLNFNEKYLKLILFSFMIPSKLYRPISEKEVTKGYVDIFLEKDIRFSDIKYEWLIELKYLKKTDKDKLQLVKEKGLEQLQRYHNSRGINKAEGIKMVLLIFVGKDEFYIEYLQ